MYSHNYFAIELAVAVKLAAAGRAVWYFVAQPGAASTSRVAASGGSAPPPGTVLAMVASQEPTIAGAALIMTASRKDPIPPPPPPPPVKFSKAGYLEDPEVKQFLNISRDTSPL